MDSHSKIISIQSEYLEILKNSELVSGIDFKQFQKEYFNGNADTKYFSIPKNIIDDNQILVKTRYGYQPKVVKYIENLFEQVENFWIKNKDELYYSIKEMEGKYIQISDNTLSSSIHKYGFLYNGFIVSEQILHKKEAYKNADNLNQWKNLVISTVGTIYHQIVAEGKIYTNDESNLAIIAPSSILLDKGTIDIIHDAADKLTFHFFSLLFNEDIDSFPKYKKYVYSTKINFTRLDKSLLDTLFSRFNASNFYEYISGVRKLIIEEEGTDWPLHENEYNLMYLDIWSRIREFERFALDSYRWGQEVEIPLFDIPFYNWWYSASSQLSAKVLGIHYNEDYLIKLSPFTQKLSFLENISTDKILEIRKEDFCENLRNDFELSKLKIKTSSFKDFHQIVNEVDIYLKQIFDNFDSDLSKAIKLKSKTLKENILLTSVNAVLTLTSIVFPPISVITFVWGKSLSDVLKDNKKMLQEVENKIDRPISSLIKLENNIVK